MRTLITFGLLFSAHAGAEQFALQIGNSVAVQTPPAKVASFVFRAVGCGDPSKVELNATAEGLVGGERQSKKLSRITPGPAPGVYIVPREWPTDGVWIVNLSARCAN